MSDRDESAVEVPNGMLAKFRYSITNLWDRFGQQDQIGIALAVNMLLTVFGILVYIWTDGILAFIGAVWGVLHVLAIIKWVAGL
jgi:diacylglycerol kinase